MHILIVRDATTGDIWASVAEPCTADAAQEALADTQHSLVAFVECTEVGGGGLEAFDRLCGAKCEQPDIAVAFQAVLSSVARAAFAAGQCAR